jgi:hypothetical protein
LILDQIFMGKYPFYIVDAFWDAEAGVWVATSDEGLGLATEAPTIEQLTQKLRVIIPELIQLNQLLPADYQGSIDFELISDRRFVVDSTIKSKHTANAVLKQAGLPKGF